MAISLVQKSTGKTGTGTSITTNALGVAATAANLLLAWIGSNDGSCTNPVGYTTVIDIIDTTNDDFIRLVGKIAAGGESTMAFTALGGNSHCIGSMEYTGNVTTDLASCVDVTASSTVSVGVTSKTSGTTATTAQNDELSVALWHVRADVTSESYSNSFVEQYALFLATSNNVADKIESAAGTKESTMSWTTSGSAIGAIATFKAASSSLIDVSMMNDTRTPDELLEPDDLVAY